MNDDVLKFLQRILKNKHFWFVVIVYPGLCLIYSYAKDYFIKNPLPDNFEKLYSNIMFICMFALVVFAGYELIEKRLTYKIQGDKLRIKQGDNWRKNGEGEK